ncbi:MAG: hypothetical protein P1V35_14360 [Planctomycetota bacterium]|nr:hypothetical protein [Planctomycetota bacterium]
MRSIAQFFRAEWREYRGTLLGLWAASVVLILVAFFARAQKYVTDPFAPAAFACLGYLGFILAVLPRVFRSEPKDPQRAFLRRTPGGLNHSFMGKFLFVYAGLLGTILIPFLFTASLMYFQAPENLQTLVDTKDDSLGFAYVVAFLHAAPLLIVSWGLPFRWLLLAIPVAAAMAYGACTLAINASYYALADPALSTVVLICTALVLSPWLPAWFSYRAPKGFSHLRRWACTSVLFAVGLAPAWGLGVMGAINQVRHAYFFDTGTHDFRFDDPYLSSNGRFIYSDVRTSHRNLPKVNWLPHAIRIDLEDGSVTNFGMGSFCQITPEGVLRHDGNKLPRADELLLLTFKPQLPWMVHQNSGTYSVRTDSGQSTQLDSEATLRNMWPNARSFGLSDPWRVMPYGVGLGTHLMAQNRGEQTKEAIFDESRNLVFHALNFPDEIRAALNRHRLKALPGLWLASTSEIGRPYLLYDPATTAIEASQVLTGGEVIGPALVDGRLLIRDGMDFALYDSARDTIKALNSMGAMVPIPHFQRSPNMMIQEYFALDHLVNTDGLSTRIAMYDVRARGTNPNGPMDRYLGWLDANVDTIRWHPWNQQDHVFGILDDQTILFTENSQRIIRMDLDTGERTCLFPLSR